MTVTDETARRGKFSIDIGLIRCDPTLAKSIMGRCIIHKADYDYYSGSITYVAECDDFEEISKGEYIPRYIWVMEETNKAPVLTARRIDA